MLLLDDRWSLYVCSFVFCCGTDNDSDFYFVYFTMSHFESFLDRKKWEAYEVLISKVNKLLL